MEAAGVAGNGKDVDGKSSFKLSQAQLEAIYAPIDRPLLILAAAGSGKTTVICHRILHLLSKDVAPKDILALTFTRRAGHDLINRLKDISFAELHLKEETSSKVTGIRVGTFHSFCLSVLRAFPDCAGLVPNFVVFTPKMQLDLLETLVKEWYAQIMPEIGCQATTFQKKLNGSISHQKGCCRSPPSEKGFFKTTAYRLLQHLQKVQPGNPQANIIDVDFNKCHGNGFSDWIFKSYQERICEANGIDFNGFVRHTLNVFQQKPNMLEISGFKAKFIFVDEFQDTDTDQFDLLKIISEGHDCITVVGDDDQQIYSWRGASGLRNIQMFGKFFPTAVTLKLEQNFRSTGIIVAAARSLISKNKNRVPKTVRTSSATGLVMSVCECRNELCEATAIVDFIKSMNDQGVPLHEIAVLYRLQRIGFEIKNHLQLWGIECDVRGSGLGLCGNQFSVMNSSGKSVEVGAVFHDILAVLSLGIWEADDMATMRLLNLFCPNMNPHMKECLSYLKFKNNCSLLQAARVARSHFVGILACDDLISYAPAKSVSLDSESHCLVLKGMHAMLRLILATRNDSKQMGIRDVILNILQQISYVRGNEHVVPALKSELNQQSVNNKQKLSLQKDDNSAHDNLIYAGVKALLEEACCFDAELGCASKNGTLSTPKETEKATIQGSYTDLKAHKKMKIHRGYNNSSLIWKHGLSRDLNCLDKIKGFLDNLTLKIHDSELGEHNQITSAHSNGHAMYNLACKSGVTLSTIHQAKGLEWSVVILARANEGVMPVSTSDFVSDASISGTPRIIDAGIIVNEGQDTCMLGQPITSLLGSTVGEVSLRDGIEEERRLMYVALTRAKHSILVTHVVYGGGQNMEPSRFLAEIPPGLVRRKLCYESKSPKPGLFLGTRTSSPTSTETPYAGKIKNKAPVSVSRTNSSNRNRKQSKKVEER